MKKTPIKNEVMLQLSNEFNETFKKLTTYCNNLESEVARLTKEENALRSKTATLCNKVNQKATSLASAKIAYAKEQCNTMVKGYSDAVITLRANCFELTAQMKDYEKLKKESIELKESNAVLRGMLVKKGKLL